MNIRSALSEEPSLGTASHGERRDRLDRSNVRTTRRDSGGRKDSRVAHRILSGPLSNDGGQRRGCGIIVIIIIIISKKVGQR